MRRTSLLVVLRRIKEAPALSFRRLETPPSRANHFLVASSTTDFSTKFGDHPRRSSFSSDASGSVEKPPEIELEFIGPEPEGNNKYPVERVTATSGSKLLRNLMLDNNIDLYASFRKVMNCGGRGLCGTCIVEIVQGKDLLSERSKAELKHLNKKPESWRLACQTKVGNSENSGKVVVQRQPQRKK